jgi:alkylation response protein AidB-like acyl-CoA dehydrogenase
MFPADRDAKRRFLLEAVERIRPVLEAHAAEAEAIATLPKATVAALVDSGLFRLKLPSVLGGAEADPVLQMDVIEAVSRIDPSAGWCVMIGASAIGMPGAFLPDDVLGQVFANGRIPTAAGVFMPTGRATRVDGGYRVTGRWSFASGIRHAEWVSGTAFLNGTESGTRTALRMVMPISSVRTHDNWQVAGLKGTGSCDFSVNDVFVPDAFAWDVERARPRRGGPVYRLGLPALVANEHVAFASGVACRALDEITALASSKQRGFGQPSRLASRGSFQRTLGECEMRLRAARALAVELNERAWATIQTGTPVDLTLQTQLRAVATLVTDVAVDVASQAFRAAGGGALYQSSVLQRCLRDLQAGAQHLMVSDAAYESLGQLRLGFPDVNPMS